MRRLLAFQTADATRSVALLILRLALAVVFAAHGAQKLFGWFGGPGPAGTAEYFASLGLSPARPLATLCGLSEFGGGLLLAAGLLTPLAALALAANMALAAKLVTVAGGFFSTDGQRGFEINLVLAAMALALALLGPGAISLDHALWRSAGRRRGLAPADQGLTAERP